MTSEGLRIVTIYRHPADFPGKYVVRAHLVAPGGVLGFERAPLAVTDTLEEARAAVPPGMTWLGRQPEDDPVIEESWI